MTQAESSRRRRWLLLPAILALSLIVVAITARPAPPHPWFQPDDPDVLVIAHQGGNHHWPDETMLAFENAAVLGVDVLEMDSHITADGVLVAIHDPTVDRTTDGSGVVSEMTYAEIAELDAAYHWTPRTPEGTPIDPTDFPYRGEGLRIPTLESIMETFPNHRLMIEIKPQEPSIAQPLCDLIRAQGRQTDVMVGSSVTSELNAFRRACPEVATGGHYGDVVVFYTLKTVYLEGLYSPPGAAFQVPREWDNITVLSPRFVQAAHQRGMDVHAWTIDTEEEMRRMIEMGVDGIITNEPALLLEILGR